MRHVTEGTPSLWKEFVWPYYDNREECSVKEVLKVCGQHVKVLSFPYCRVPSTLVEMLQYCSNVQHFSLPSTKLDPEQLRKPIHHMGCLQTLELKVDNDYSDIKQLLLSTGQLRELAIISCGCYHGSYYHLDLQGRIQDLARGGAQTGRVVGGWGDPDSLVSCAFLKQQIIHLLVVSHR